MNGVLVNASAQAFTAEAIARTGVAVTVQRLSGQAPRIVTFEAEVTVRLMDAMPDISDPSREGVSARAPGALTQYQRKGIVMAQDLAAARFPLPLKKNDRLRIDNGADPADPVLLPIIAVDSFKRAFAGAIEFVVTGVQ